MPRRGPYLKFLIPLLLIHLLIGDILIRLQGKLQHRRFDSRHMDLLSFAYIVICIVVVCARDTELAAAYIGIAVLVGERFCFGVF